MRVSIQFTGDKISRALANAGVLIADIASDNGLEKTILSGDATHSAILSADPAGQAVGLTLSNTTVLAAADASLTVSDAGLSQLALSNTTDAIGMNTHGHIYAKKISAPPGAPSAGFGLLFMQDDGGGKMQWVARFPSGAVQVIATEP